ncbi:hypothetical protein EVG18_10610 [Burkholderia pyrrocinia]|nr:hypothetical protein EVG18_10610 [Burkholderia pyrrocinia]
MTGAATAAAVLSVEQPHVYSAARADGIQLADSVTAEALQANADARRAQAETATLNPFGTDVVGGAGDATAARWMSEPADQTGEDGMAPQGDLRQIFLGAVQSSIDRSPQLQQAYAEYQASIADVDEAKGRRWPQLQIGSQTKSVEFGGASSNTAGRGNAITANLTTPVYDWGYLSSTIGSREKLSDAGKQRYEAELESNAYTVTATLAELAKQKLLLDVSQQFVDRMQELVTMLSQIVAVDRGRASELTQAKARLLQAEGARDAVSAKARDTELSLRKLVGDTPVPLPDTAAWNISPANLDQMLSTMGTHPSLKQAHSEAQSARLQADAVKASSRPAINWVVSKTTGRDELNRKQPFQTMLTLNWNAFQGGSAKAAQKAALQRARASEQKMEQTRLDLEFQIRAADEDARNLLSRASLYGNLVGETDRVRKAFFEQWYHLGKRTLLDVLQAENDHYGNRVSEITSRYDGYQAVFRERSSAGELVNWLRGDA